MDFSLSPSQFTLRHYINHLEFKAEGPIITITPWMVVESSQQSRDGGSGFISTAPLPLLKYFRGWMNYLQLVDLTVIDNMALVDVKQAFLLCQWQKVSLSSVRWGVIYNLLSIGNESRFRLRLLLRKPQLPSIQAIYPNANWLEREVFDSYGILFWNHPDLRRILTDYGFEYFPLRKDFPLSGYTEVRFDEELGQMVIEPINLSQDFRVYSFLNPWETRNK